MKLVVVVLKNKYNFEFLDLNNRFILDGFFRISMIVVDKIPTLKGNENMLVLRRYFGLGWALLSLSELCGVSGIRNEKCVIIYVSAKWWCWWRHFLCNCLHKCFRKCLEMRIQRVEWMVFEDKLNKQENINVDKSKNQNKYNYKFRIRI